MEFFKNIGKVLLMFNFISIFFLVITIFLYSIIQYMFEPLVGITQLLFSDVASQNILYRILNIALIMPTYLDYIFLLIVVSFSLNIFYVSFKTEKSNIYYTLLFSLLGLPTFIFFLQQLNVLKVWALGFLQSAITYNVNMRFFNYISNNSIEFTIFIFIIAIAIRSIDWENVKIFRKSNPIDTQEDRSFNEMLEQ